MLQAHGYTPALIYVKAEADIQKHMAVSILPGGAVQPSNPSLGIIVGFALEDASAGEFLAVQVDGVLYGYQRQTLSPGIWYYQGTDGELRTDSSGGGHIAGFAVDESTFRIFIYGGSASKSSAEIISGAGSLEDLSSDTDIVDGSGSLSEAIENGWDDWDSLGSDGTLTDLFMDGKVEGNPNEQTGGESGEEGDSGGGILDGGTLDYLFGGGEGEEDEGSDLFGDLGGLGGLGGLSGGDDSSEEGDGGLGGLGGLLSGLGLSSSKYIRVTTLPTAPKRG